ncbi:hypothetical protein VNO77_09203 [Canavalia gladiata]|uniref:ATP synthase subunit delta', mitochondrial n=1 Tax=Canavalia gladiata TaxID=3824 RepID=A0AAN9M9P8_CANGL
MFYDALSSKGMHDIVIASRFKFESARRLYWIPSACRMISTMKREIGLGSMQKNYPMVLNLAEPPFGVKGCFANKFIGKALTFKPNLLILIVPKITKRLDRKKGGYDLIWEDNEMLSGKVVERMGSAYIRQMQLWAVSKPKAPINPKYSLTQDLRQTQVLISSFDLFSHTHTLSLSLSLSRSTHTLILSLRPSETERSDPNLAMFRRATASLLSGPTRRCRFSTEVPATPAADSSFVEAWKKASPNLDPPKTPLSFMKPRPPVPSSLPSKLTVNFVLPYTSQLAAKEVDMVIVPATTGQMGVLPGHVATIAELKPGLLSVHEGTDVTKYFVSSGFAFVHANSVADIIAVEAVPLDQIDANQVQKGLQEFTQKLNSATTDLEKAEAQIGVDVHSALNSALSG